MKEQFTPAPWHVNKSDNCLVYDADNIGVCSTRHNDGEPRRNAKANATIIAAAPEMYEALEKMEISLKYQIEEIGNGSAAILIFEEEAKLIFKALSKARGENKTIEQ